MLAALLQQGGEAADSFLQDLLDAMCSDDASSSILPGYVAGALNRITAAHAMYCSLKAVLSTLSTALRQRAQRKTGNEEVALPCLELLLHLTRGGGSWQKALRSAAMQVPH